MASSGASRTSSGVIVTGVTVTGVIVTGVIVTGVIVTGVTVTGVIVTGVIMTGVIMTRGGRLVAGCGQGWRRQWVAAPFSASICHLVAKP